jgi:hypothetical protein
MRLLSWLQERKLKVYKYIEDEKNKCSIGSFEQIRDVY